MEIEFIKPKIELIKYINYLWVFKSPTGLSNDDCKILAPDGTTKIIIPIKNSYDVSANQYQYKTTENKIYFTGLWDSPVNLLSTSTETLTIGINLNAEYVSKIIPSSMSNLKNKIFSIEDLLGNKGGKITEHLSNIEGVHNKIDFIQLMLLELIYQQDQESPIVEFCMREIKNSYGLISIKDLEFKTGYTKRYLDNLFKNYMGLSPKLLCNIIRFNLFYDLYSKSNSTDFYKEDLYNYYYDQAHFIKEFKRFTGHSPYKFSKMNNDLGKMFL